MSIPPAEFDASYFDGKSQTYSHTAGYSWYKRWYRKQEYDPLAQHEKFAGWFSHFATGGGFLTNRNILEVGCAKGFLVEAGVDAGYDIYGMDCSSYAVQGPWAIPDEVYDADGNLIDTRTAPRTDVQPRLTVHDALSIPWPYLTNQFDYVISINFLECLGDADLPAVISEMDRICKRFQVHVINPQPSLSYTAHTILEWRDSGWFPGGTRLLPDINFSNVVVVP